MSWRTVCSTRLQLSRMILPNTHSSTSSLMSRFLRTKYQQYKHDTVQLSTWLAQAAIQHGFDPSRFCLGDIVDAPGLRTAAQVKNAKKKARARAKAKLGKETVQPEGSEPVGEGQKQENAQIRPGSYILQVAQYTEIARFLIDKGVRIPGEIKSLLGRCIDLRVRCSRRYVESARQSHQHFIDTLVKVGTIFGFEFAQSKTKAASDAHTPDDIDLGNRFAALGVDEEEDEEDLPDINLPLPPKPSPKARDASGMSFAPAFNREEALVSVVLHFEDIHRVRSHIKGIWRDYKAGKVDLITASVVTNTALELLQKSHDELMSRVLPMFDGDFVTVMIVLYTLLGGGNGLQPRLFPDVKDQDTEYVALFDFLLFPLFQIIGGMADLIRHGDTLPMYKPGYYGFYDPDLARSEASFEFRWRQGQILISEAFTDFDILLMVGNLKLGPGQQSANYFYIDSLVLGLDRFVKSRKVSLHLMTMCQVYVDINLTIGSGTKQGLKDLVAGATRISRGLRDREIAEGGACPANWDAAFNEPKMSSLRSEAEYWQQGEQISNIRQFIGQFEKIPATENYRSYLLERNPMLCGLVLFRLQLQYHQSGIALSNTWGSILYTAHLWKACQHSGSLPGQPLLAWPDMEFLLSLHGADNVFGGRVPATIDESNNCFLLMAGYSTDVLQAHRHVFTDTKPPAHLLNRNRKATIMSKTGCRHLVDKSQITPMFFHKYTNDVLSDLRFDLSVLEQMLIDIGGTKLRRARHHRSEKFSIVQLLSVLEAGLQDSSLSLRFDYIAMHNRCLTVLRQIKDQSHEYLIGKLGSSYLEDDSQLPFVTGWILRFATFSGRASEMALGVKREGKHASVVKSKLLMGATEKMRAYLKDSKEGDIEVRRLGWGK